MSEKCKSCTGILGRLCPSAAKEILPPITSAPVTQDPSAALPSREPLYTLSFFVNIFFKGPFFERINTHSHPERLKLPFSISLSALLGIASPLWSPVEECSLTLAEKSFYVTEWQPSNYNSDLKIAQSTLLAADGSQS